MKTLAHALLDGIVQGWEAEVRFHPIRRWRFDYAHRDLMIAIEIDGGAWSRGRHTRGAGFVKDMEKRNTAQILGWRVFHFTPDQITTTMPTVIREAIAGRKS